jgi:hypothetical protein
VSHPVHQRAAKPNLGRTEESLAATAIVPKETSSLLAVTVFLSKETSSLGRETTTQPLHFPAEQEPLPRAETQMRRLQTKTTQTYEPKFLSQFPIHAASSDSF